MEKGAIIKHNIKKAPKTGDWAYMLPVVDKDKCTGCTTCNPFCPEAAISMKPYKKDQKDKADVDYDFCKGCGVCSTICPVKAITMRKK